MTNFLPDHDQVWALSYFLCISELKQASDNTIRNFKQKLAETRQAWEPAVFGPSTSNIFTKWTAGHK